MENNIYAEIIATIAGILSTMAFIPQAYKIFITNETEDLDFFTFTLLSVIYFLILKERSRLTLLGFRINHYSALKFTYKHHK